jgi:SOUL heme-binding protein
VPPVEVRQYDPYLIAEVTFKKGEAQDMKAALSGGFRAIAGYIFDSKVCSRKHHLSRAAGLHLLHAAGRSDHCKCSLHWISLQHAHPQTVRKTHEINWD